MNPFMEIVPRESEALVDRQSFFKELKEGAESSLDGRKILALEGTYGSGKTIVVNKLIALLKRNKIEVITLSVTGDIINELRNLPLEKGRDIFVVIDRFDLVESMDRDDIKKILDLMLEFSGKKLTFLVKTTESALRKARDVSEEFSSRLSVHRLPMLDYEYAKQMAIDRLNEARTSKKNSLEPFTDDEFRKLWDKANGNPRMILMLCAALYEQRRD